MTNRNEFNRNARATERARAITARKKASAKKKRMALSITAAALVIIAAASFMIAGFTNGAKTANKNVTKSVNTTSAAAPAMQDTATTAIATAADDEYDNNAAYNENADYDNSYDETAYSENNNDSADEQTPAENSKESDSQDKIEIINGERVYIDTKRTAPEESGEPAHFYATGKTSYGFDWNYDTDNCNFVIRCDYNFDEQQYDFSFYGVTPGTAHVTVYHNVNDKTQVPDYITIYVDNDLNVTIA